MEKNRWFIVKAKNPDGEVVNLGFSCKKDKKEAEKIIKEVCEERGYEFISVKVE